MEQEETDLQEENLKVDEGRTWGSSFTLGGTEYATSLFWQSLQNQEDPNAEVLESSQGVVEGADLYCVKKGKTAQFGICVSADGYKPGQTAAATSLVTALSDQTSFVAIFKVPNGWWYVCVRDDVILANGDMLYHSEEDAQRQFRTMLMVPDWKLKIAPPEWEIDDTIYPNLEEVLDRGSKVKLQKINRKGKYFNLIVGAGTIVGLWICYSLFMSFLDSKPKPIITPIKPKVVKVEEVEEPKPWEDMIVLPEQLEECHEKTKLLMSIMPPGWDIAGITCSTSAASTSWRRRYGRIGIVDKALKDSNIAFAAKSISNDGNTAMAAINFNDLNTGDFPPNYGVTELINNLNNLFQSMDMRINLSTGSYTSQQNKIYHFVNFKFQSNYNPTIWKNIFDEFSGIKINSIKYNTKTGVWDYEGAIYAL